MAGVLAKLPASGEGADLTWKEHGEEHLAPCCLPRISQEDVANFIDLPACPTRACSQPGLCVVLRADGGCARTRNLEKMTRLKAGVATGLCVLQAVCCVLMGAVQAAEERLMEAETAAHAR
eukprot:1146841-Pelagomonas_calceolata.AAC.8